MKIFKMCDEAKQVKAIERVLMTQFEQNFDQPDFFKKKLKQYLYIPST